LKIFFGLVKFNFTDFKKSVLFVAFADPYVALFVAAAVTGHKAAHVAEIFNHLDVVSAPTFSSFRRRLKPFLFQQSYPDTVM